MSEATPHISIVAVGRNDNYGGDFSARLQSFVKWTVHHLGQLPFRSELIFVNYNPTDDIPIERFIEWPNSNDRVSIRIITVPSETHRTIVSQSGVKDVPVQEYIAKNIGIRRANGNFVLAMNPDILISKEVFSGFSKLNPGAYYRANRLDHNGPYEMDETAELKKQLDPHVIAAWFKGRNYKVESITPVRYARLMRKAALSNLWRRMTVHFRPLLDFLSIPVYYDNIEYRYHCNASGDFLLMHRNAWEALKGYDEKAYISLHVDSLMVLQAAFSGLKEVTFFHPIYHRDHERRFDAVAKDSDDQRQAYGRFRRDIETMTAAGKPIIYNGSDWGLAEVRLPETVL